jgi:type I restriction enzyme, R subunit
VLQNYDEFASLKALQSVDMNDPAAVEAFKAKHYLSDDDLTALQAIKLPAERKIQDYRSTYNDVRDWLRREKSGAEKENPPSIGMTWSLRWTCSSRKRSTWTTSWN